MDELFIGKAGLFIKVIESRWESGKQEASQIVELMRRHGVEAKRVLEVGCGNGRVAIPLAEHGYKVTCLDISAPLIEDGRRRAEEAGISDRIDFVVGDAREASTVLKGSFDFIYMIWTTLLGYYDEMADLAILREMRKLISERGALAILNTTSRDLVVRRQASCGSSAIMEALGKDLVMVDYPRFDPTRSRLLARWIFYEKSGRDLKYIDEATLDLRLYSLHEVVDLAERSGWDFVAAYNDLESFGEYIAGKSPLNVLLSPEGTI